MRRAFSLLELIIAFGIIATAILLVAGIFSTLFRQSQKSQDLSTAALVADAVLAEFAYGILNNTTDSAAFFGGSYVPDPVTGVRLVDRTEYRYAIYHQEIAELTDAAPPAPDTSRTRLARIQVQWSGQTDPVRRGTGVLQVQASRLINEQELR